MLLMVLVIVDDVLMLVVVTVREVNVGLPVKVPAVLDVSVVEVLVLVLGRAETELLVRVLLVSTREVCVGVVVGARVLVKLVLISDVAMVLVATVLEVPAGIPVKVREVFDVTVFDVSVLPVVVLALVLVRVVPVLLVTVVMVSIT
jgi:hypothetical protein